MTRRQAVRLMVLPAVHVPTQVGHCNISFLYYSFLSSTRIDYGGHRQTGVQITGRIGLLRRTMARSLYYLGISKETPESYGARVLKCQLESHSGAFPPANVHAYYGDSTSGLRLNMRSCQTHRVLGAYQRARAFSHNSSSSFRTGPLS